ncbi:DUF4349 domain-containing protein [Streptomyces minutiscleroticus]
MAAALALAGCSGSASGGSSAADEARAASAPQRQEAGRADEAGGANGAKRAGGNGRTDAGNRAATAPARAGAYVVRTASLTVEVHDVGAALAEARTRTENAGGFVGDEDTTRDSRGRERSRAVLRVPVGAYEDVLDDLAGYGRLVRRSAEAVDVTSQVVDVESRVSTQRASVARVRELMERAKKLSDVVALEGELSTRQADLEALLAQQASLKARTGTSTITLTLTTAPPKETGTPQKDDGPGFEEALEGGWDAFATTFRWIGVGLLAALPFLVLAALLGWLVRRIVRVRRARGARYEQPGPDQDDTQTLPPVPALDGEPGPGPEPERRD